MLRRINDALPGLVAGILIYGVVVQLTGLWFVSDRIRFSLGLWYGIVIAVGMSVNMATMIYDAVAENTGKRANYRVIAKSIFRYLVVVVLFTLLGYFNFGSLFSAFLGVLGLKISAYLQPVFARTGWPVFRMTEYGPIDGAQGAVCQETGSSEVPDREGSLELNS